MNKKNIGRSFLIFSMLFLIMFSLSSCFSSPKNGGSSSSGDVIETYSITYVTNHGKAPDGKSGITKISASDLVELTDSEYEFKGWYLDQSYTQKAQVGEISSNVTLYAKWEEKATYYNVSFLDEDNSVIETKSVKENTIVSRPSDPSKAGYNFINWYSNIERTELFDFYSNITETTNVYALFEERTYDVTYYLNYDSKIEYRYEKGFINYIPLRIGYVLEGWYTDSSLTNKFDTSKRLTSSSSSFPLYAKWVEDTFEGQIEAPTMTFDGNDITWNHVRGARAYQIEILTVNLATTLVDETIQQTSYTFPAYQLEAGSYVVRLTALGDGVVSVNSNKVSKTFKNRVLDKVSGIAFNQQTNILTWNSVDDAEYYEIHYNSNLSNTLIAEVYNCDFDFSDFDADTYNIIIKAIMYNYETSEVSYTFKKIRLLAPEAIIDIDSDDLSYILRWDNVRNATSYKLTINDTVTIDVDDNYYRVPNNSSYWIDGKVKVAVNSYEGSNYLISVNAQAVELNKLVSVNVSSAELNSGEFSISGMRYKQVEVTFDYNYNSITEKVIVSANNGLDYIKPTRSGYIFRGWYKDKSCTQIYDFTQTIENDLTLYAGWYSSSGYTVYNLGSGSTSISSTTSTKRIYFSTLTSATVKGTIQALTSGNYYFAIYDYTSGTTISEQHTYNTTGLNSITMYTEAGHLYYATISSASSKTINFSLYVYGGDDTPSDGGKARTNYVYVNDDNINSSFISCVDQEINISYNEYFGYDFNGIKVNGEVVTTNNSVQYTLVNGKNNISVDTSIKEDIAMYNFTSNFNTCEITGIKNTEHYSIVIPEYVTSISSIEFNERYKLVEIYNLSSLNIQVGSTINGNIGYNALIIHTSLDDESVITKDDNGYIFAYIDNKGYLIGYEGNDTQLVLPSSFTYNGNEIDNYEINKYAFYNCSNITSIEIPNSVTSIGSFAFGGCSSLQTITLPFVGGSKTSNTYLGYIFGASSYSENSSYVPASLNEVIILDGCTSIGSNAFYNCNRLTSIEIANSVTSVGSNAFYNCNSLKKVYYNGTIGDWCNLVFTNVNQNPMYYASNFYILDENGDIEYNGNKYSLLTELVIPNTVTSIGSYQFYNCSNLTSVTIPNSVTSIGSGAFSGCSSLQSITIPFIGDRRHSSTDTYQYPFGYIFGTTSYTGGVSTTQSYYGYAISTYSTINTTYYIPSTLKEVLITDSTYIPYGAFYNCNNLTSIEIPNSVTSIGEVAFEYCNSLVNITIGNCVTSIGQSAFYNCTSLENIYYDGTIANWCNITFDSIFSNPMYYTSNFYILDENGVVVHNDNKYSLLTELVIPNTVTSIGTHQFYNCSNITSIEIPNSVISIGTYAFEYCTSLTNVTIGDSVTIIGSSAFSNCNKLTSIEIPNSVTNIERYAFYNCNKLTSIEIPNSVTSIGDGAFRDCSSLESITLPFVGESKTSNTFLGYIFGASGYSWNSTYVPASLKEVIILDGCTSIGKYAFSGCSSLVNIAIGNSVTSIESTTFNNCTSLENVYYNGTIGDWCNILFTDATQNPMYYASNFYILDENGVVVHNGNKYTLLTELVIPNTITLIGNYKFYGFNNLTSVTIPNSVTSIVKSAFRNCSSLESITLPFVGESKTSNTFLGYIFGASSYSENSSNVPASLKEVIILDGCTSIGSNAFYNCNKLTSIEIANSVISIEASAFSNCTLLENVAIGNSVTSIGQYAFSGCSSLTSIEIPNSVTSIGQYAFSNCSNLISIEIPNSVTNIESYAFYNCNKLTSIEIPNSVTSIGSAAFSGCSSLTSIEIPNSVTSIGSNAFNNCTLLENVAIGNSVTSIGSYAFHNCNKLTSIEIPNSVTSIRSFALGGCSSLQTITLPFVGESKTFNTYLGYIFGASSYSNNSGYVPASLKEVIILDGCTSIDQYAFYNCNKLTSIEIPNSVTSIGIDSFYNCSNLTSIEIPNSVTNIGGSAFKNCTSLENVYYDGTISDWSNISFSNYDSNPMSYASNFYILDENGDIEYNGNKYSLLTN